PNARATITIHTIPEAVLAAATSFTERSVFALIDSMPKPLSLHIGISVSVVRKGTTLYQDSNMNPDKVPSAPLTPSGTRLGENSQLRTFVRVPVGRQGRRRGFCPFLTTKVSRVPEWRARLSSKR